MNSLASLPIGSPAGVETMLPNRIADKRGQWIFSRGKRPHAKYQRIYHLHGGQASRSHAHRNTRQILYCVTGSIEILLSVDL